jgi:hypothetical protein
VSERERESMAELKAGLPMEPKLRGSNPCTYKYFSVKYLEPGN